MKKKKNKPQHRDSPIYDSLYIILVIIALSSLFAPYIYFILVKAIPYSGLISIALPAVLVTAGYGLQYMFGSIFHFKRSDDNSAYEHTESFFNFGYAIPSFTVIAIVSVFVGKGVSAWIQELSRNTAGLYYDRYSLIPLLITVAAVLCLAAGVVIWFYPFNRIISVRTMIPITMLFFINLMMTLIFAEGVTLMFTTVCLFVYFICAFILLNQSNVIATYSKTKNTFVTVQARLYNVSVVIVAMLILTVIVIGVLSVITGVTVIGKGAVLYILRVMLRDEETYEEASEIAESFSDSVFSGVIDPADTGGNIAKLFLMLFFVIILGVMLFFIISRRKDVWNGIKKFIANLSAAIMTLLNAVFGYRKKENTRMIIPDYLDEEIKMDENSVREFGAAYRQGKNLYRDYLAHLSTLHDPAKRISYAYGTLVRCWLGQKYGLEVSDTPREIKDKIDYFKITDKLDNLTELYETTEYAETAPDASHAEEAVESMSALIKKYS